MIDCDETVTPLGLPPENVSPDTNTVYVPPLPGALIATAQGWGGSKPDPRFCAHVLAAVPFPAGQIAYIGDRIGNDMKPARAAGLRTIHLRRGPWGYIFADHPDLAGSADWQVGSLAAIPPRRAEVNRA